MPSDKTLNAKNLAALGPERLAALLLEVAADDATLKRRLRLELASLGGGDVGGEVRKRLVSIARSRSFLDWRKVKDLARDLDVQREAIVTHVAPGEPAEAFELLWRMLEMAPSLYERCDDSDGVIGDIIAFAREDLADVASRAGQAVIPFADRVFEAACGNEYGQFDRIISMLAPALGADGLKHLKGRFEQWLAAGPAATGTGQRKIIGISSRGPIYEADYEKRRHARLVRSALTEIADALGDVDGFRSQFSPEERTNPFVAAEIATRLLAEGRSIEALSALNEASHVGRHPTSWPEWQRAHIDVLDALERSSEAQAERWAAFERGLNADYLREYLKRLPEFEDLDAEERALSFASKHARLHQALAFLLDWPALDRAGDVVSARWRELDGNDYGLLAKAAETLEERHPLAATLMLRAMIDHSLNAAKYKRYGHAARHLQTCEYLVRRIDDFGEHPDHTSYVADLRQRHGRKSGFWNA